MVKIEIAGPEWACGCDQCRFGIINAPPLTRLCGLGLERVVQMELDLVEFCECQAGKLYRISLLNLKQKYVEEAKRDDRMSWCVERQSHPEIESMKRVLLSSPPPSIQYQGL